LQGISGGLNVSNGIVNGLPNNSARLQFSAPAVQPGNSGGALLDRSGTLLGILSSKFTARFGFVSGVIAVRKEVVQAFLSAQSVRPILADRKPELSIEGITELARKSVFAIECLN
jgi:S1-C subfamily serine protease